MHRILAVSPLLLMVCGCPSPTPSPLEPIDLRDAIGIVNANTGQIAGCLKATGSARGHFRLKSGRRQQFDLRLVVQVLPPRHMYATFKSGLGTEEMLLGSNAEKYWAHVRLDDGTYRVGTYEALGDAVTSALPLQPDTLIEALGLNELPDTTVGAAGPVQRIVESYQQLIFLAYSRTGQGMVRKEYWLDRFEPRLIRRVLFRDELGRVVMNSWLSEYRREDESGPLLPHRIRVEWPLKDAVLDFGVHGWKPMPDRGPDHPVFVAPHERGAEYRYMIDLDTGAPLG